MRRRLLIAVFGAGTILGFGHGIAHMVRGHHHGHWAAHHDRDWHCDRDRDR